MILYFLPLYIPDLHHPDFDFRDEIIETGIKMFDGIIRKILS